LTLIDLILVFFMITNKIKVTESSEVFKAPEKCGPLKAEEIQGFGKLMSGLITGFQKSMSKPGF